MPATPSRAKKPQDRKYGQKSWANQLVDLDLPSGELAQVRRPGMQGLIKAGILNSVDGLTGIVQGEVIPKAEGKPSIDAKEIMKDPAKLESMMESVDKIVMYVVVKPEVLPTVVTQEMVNDETNEWTSKDLGAEIEYKDRLPGAVYVDYIDIDDKMFIMNFAVGGTRDFESFRKESQAAVGGLPDGEAAASPTK